MQFLSRWPRLGVLILTAGLVTAACGGADEEPEVTPAPIAAEVTVPATSVVESGPGGEYGCRGNGIRQFAQPQWEAPPNLTFEEAIAAPELDPGRMAYIYDAGDDADVLNPSPAELEAAAAYWELERVAGIMWELADDTADNEFVGTWIDNGVLILATTATETAPIEATLREFAVPFEVVQVDFRAKQLNRWGRAIADQETAGDPMLVNIDTVRNVIMVQASPEAALDLTNIPCAAVELIFDGDF